MEYLKNEPGCINRAAPHPRLLRKLMNTRKFLNGALVQPEDMVSIEMFNNIVSMKQTNLPEFYKEKPRVHIPGPALMLKKPPAQIKVLTLLFDFKTNIHKRSKDVIHRSIFRRDFPDLPSVRDYYWEVSNGRMDMTGDTFGWYTADHEIDHYYNDICGYPDMDIPGNNATQVFVAEVVKKAMNADNIDLSKYVNEPNSPEKYVDYLIIVHAGNDALYGGVKEICIPKECEKEECDKNNCEKEKSFWSYQGELTEPLEFNGIKIKRYILISEYDHYPLSSIGVCCHEFGHLLGLPDLYDTNYATAGIGAWCLMSGGMWNNEGDTPAHPCAYAKSKLGWVDPMEINRSGLPEITDMLGTIRRNNDAFKSAGVALNSTIFEGYVDFPNVEKNVCDSVAKIYIYSGNDKEYFLLENRQPIGFDAYLPSSGLLIWHVNERKENNDSPGLFTFLASSRLIPPYILINADGHLSRNPNDDSVAQQANIAWRENYAPLVMLEQADGKWDLLFFDMDSPNLGDSGDPYPGGSDNRRFGKDSVPSSLGYDRGCDYIISATVDGSSGDIMRAHIKIIQKVRLMIRHMDEYRFVERWEELPIPDPPVLLNKTPVNR